MAFDKLSYGKVWTSSTDFPTQEDSEAQVRADLQYHPNAIRDFINDFLTSLESGAGAGNIITTDGNLQDVLNVLKEDIQTVAAGGVPSATQCVAVPFAAADWVACGEDAEHPSYFTYAVPYATHRRPDSRFGYCLWSAPEDGALRSGTWFAASTSVVRADNGDIVLTAPASFDGTITFFGV